MHKKRKNRKHGYSSTRRGQITPKSFSISWYFTLFRITSKVLSLSTPNLVNKKKIRCQLFLHEECQKTLKVWRHSDDVMFFPTFEILCMFFIMYWKEHVKGSWNLKKICRYHKNWLRYGTFNFEKYRCKLWVPRNFVLANPAMLHMWCNRWL